MVSFFVQTRKETCKSHHFQANAEKIINRHERSEASMASSDLSYRWRVPLCI